MCTTSEDSFHKGPRRALLRREVESLRPPGLERSFAVWQGFWASLMIQGLDWAWMPGRIMGFHRGHLERLEGNLGHPPLFKIRADNGRFRNPKCSPQTTLASRCCAPPLCFSRENYPVTTIGGESCDSGFSPALDVMAKRREVSLHSRTILRQVWTRGPRLDIGAYSG